MYPLRVFRPAREFALSCALVAAMSGGSAFGQTWINPGTGNWFTAANWNPATVPVAGGSVLVSNGGTATLTGIAATPLLGSLIIGTASQGTGHGTVQSVGTDIRVTGGLEVGTQFAPGVSSAQGVLTITGAGGQAGQIFIGSTQSATVATSVSGQMSSAGAFTINNGNLVAGAMLDSARGSTADGSLSIGGNAGTVNGVLIVGEVITSDPARVGSQSKGSFNVLNGGGLALAGGTSIGIGTTFGVDRVADAGVPGGFRVNQAQGQVNVSGTLSFTGASTSLAIGQTTGGIVDGSLAVGTLAMGANIFNSLNIGTSSVGGQAQGSFSAGSGDLRSNGMGVGTTTGGTAQGSVALGGGGKLLGNNLGGFNVGTGSASAGELVSAIGSVNAAGGVSGFTGYNVGTLFGTIAAGSVAQGSLVGGAAAGASSTGSIQVAVLSNTSGAASASGTMTMGNALTVTSSIIVGDMFEAARGSTADGSLSIGGNVGTVSGLLLVGNITTGDPAHVGSHATGSFSVLNGGNLALAAGSGTFIGTTVGVDRVADAGAPGGFRVNQSQGQVNVTGTLSITGASAFLAIGQTTGGIVDGSLAVGTLAMGANTFNSLNIGTSGVAVRRRATSAPAAAICAPAAWEWAPRPGAQHKAASRSAVAVNCSATTAVGST